MRYTRLGGLVLAFAALSSCAGLTVADPHADPQTRMNVVAVRFDQAFRAGGMAQVTSDIEDCYRETTTPVIRHYALEDCLALDYAGYQTDLHVGRRLLKGPALPFFADQTFAARADHYGILAGFTSPQALANFLRATYTLVSMDMTRLNAGPSIIHHPLTAPQAPHTF